MKIQRIVSASAIRIPLIAGVFIGILAKVDSAQAFGFDIVGTLNIVQQLLMQIGPILSAVLFITAGIFYALGQLFPSYKRATLHSMAIDLIIGAIMVAVLSVASTGLAVASSHLLSNSTNSTGL